MEHEHLDQAALDRILTLDRTEDQNRSLLHQLAVCPECCKVGGYLLGLHRAGALPSRFSLVDIELARSRAEAAFLWEALRPVPHERRLELAQKPLPFASFGLCELLCEESRKAAIRDASVGLQFGELAVLVADLVREGAPLEEDWVYQLRAYAWAHLANARRAGGDLPGAEQAFAMAEQWQTAGEEGTGDALGYGPVLLHLKASLRLAQGRFSEAMELLDQAVSSYLNGDPEHRDRHLAGRALVKKAYALMEAGELGDALTVADEAAGLLDPAREPRLLLCLRHNLLYTFANAGRYDEARALLPEVQALSAETGSHLDRVRLRWVEGRISAGLGEAGAARAAFGEVRRAFLDQKIAYDAALVSLELAILHLKAGETAAVRELAREMVVIFQAQEVHREALAALAIFQTAAALETATAELAEEIAAFLVRARQDPAVQFETP